MSAPHPRRHARDAGIGRGALIGSVHVAVGALVAASLAVAGASPAAAADGFTFERLAGTDRYATADAIAEAAFPDGATDALLARGDDFADALAGNYLAGALSAPVLLSTQSDVPDATVDTLEALGVQTVTLLGGTAALGEAVVAELETAGFTVQRVAGTDRYDTARAIADEAGAAAVGTVDGEPAALVATGEKFPDALAGGPLSWAGGLPIVLTSTASLGAAASTTLENLGITRAYVLGGTAAVSDQAVTDIEGLGITVERLAGTDRAATSAAIADFALANLGFVDTHVSVATGAAFADAMTGGAHAGQHPAPILLSTDGSGPACTYLTARSASLATGSVYGGTTAVSDSTQTTLQDCAGEGGGGLAVAGEFELRQINTSRTCTVTAPAGDPVHLRLLRAVDVSVEEDGTLRFADADGDELADLVPLAPTITSVDGSSQPADTRAVDDVVGDGQIEVTLGAEGEGDVVLVAFADGHYGQDAGLDVDPDGAAVDQVAIGCATHFVPPEAAQGFRTDVEVLSVGADLTYFTGASDGGTVFTYMVDDGDEANGLATSIEMLRGMLSAGEEFSDDPNRVTGDVLDIDYEPADGVASTFDLTSDTVRKTPAPVAEAFADGEDGVRNDVRVEFEPPPYNGADTNYRIDRIETHPDADGGCSSSVAATAVAVGTTGASPFVDVDVPDGCWIYRTVAESPTGATATSTFSNAVATPGEPDEVRPRSTYATVLDDGDGALGVDDVIQLAFDETMAAPADGASITVSEGGTSVTFTDGADATFTLVQVTHSVGGVDRPPRTVVEVRPTSAPSSALALPATVAAHSGMTDEAGNAWDIAQSADTTLEAES